MPYKLLEDKLAHQKHKLVKRRQLVIEIKEATPCADCGENFPAYVTDFYREPGEMTVAALLNRGYSWGRILKTIRSRDLLCGNCAQERYFGNGRP